MKGQLAAIGFGLAFSLAVLGLGALATTFNDPWGAIVLIVVAPAMPFLGNRGDSVLLALVMCVVAWTIVGAFIWVAVIGPIVAIRRNGPNHIHSEP